MASSSEDDASQNEVTDKPLSRWWAVPGVAIYFLVLNGVSRFEPYAMGEAAGTSAAIFAGVLLLTWHQRREKWFWPFITTDFVVHIAAIVLIPWPAKHDYSRGDLAFVWLDLFLSGGLLGFVQWLARKGKLRLFDD